ncbi:N-acyl-D-amino-acid deacylase family protein [Gemmatimonas sp.]|uniref:N-acyl-D-amino-acid deacylase family protein n=1 Tax=Gemmatimonas sp. TaxID=1962908 RepID=UPI00391B5FB9
MTPLSRRAFLVQGTAAACAVPAMGAVGPFIHVPGRQAPDLVLRGGAVFDGLGGAAREMDVAMRAGRITAMAPRLAVRGREEIDARGLVVAPGFVDIHSHGDSSLREDPRAESVIRQGITTIVVGADGSSRFSGAADRSFSDWERDVSAMAPAVNVASMIGLGSVRGAVVGEADRRATADELARMVAMVERALSEGACGTSSGLEYTPGAFATTDELVALCRPLARRGLPYATHMRTDDDQLREAIDESIAVARGAACALQLSHLKQQGTRNWPKLTASLARLRDARAAGVDAWFDVYPYEAYQTGLTNLFPVWARDGGDAAFLKRLDDSATAPRIRSESLSKVEMIGGWDNVQIARVRNTADRDAEGQRLGAWARARGADPYEAAVGLLRRNQADVGMLGFAMSEENIDQLLAHEYGMVCSDGGGFAIDGPTRRGSPHPRGAGTMPRVLGRFVRERQALPLADAMHKMTARPADRVHLRDRGRLAVGMAGDAVVFDPATVADRATFANPFQYPVGISTVIVNGVVAIRDGQHLATPGRVLRAG